MKYAVFALLGAVLFFSPPPAIAHDHAEKPAEQETQASLSITGAYAFATSETQANGAAFLTLGNEGAESLSIVRAESDIAETIELHTHIMEDGIMKMREVEAFEIEAGGEHVLEPMGDHIMLIGLKQPLKEGESFDITLETEDGKRMNVDVSIVAPGMPPHKSEKEGAEKHEHGTHHPYP